MLNDLRKAITSSASQITDRRFYYSVAPKDVTYPFVTYHFITNVPDNDSLDKYETVRVQFNVFDDADKPDTVENIVEQLKNIFDDSEKNLTISGNNLFISINRQFVRPVQKIEDVWQAIVEYSFEIQIL